MKKFNYFKISLASSKKILGWSSGEIKNSETINYRTLKPEPNGLFCQRIFGPLKKNYCDCNRYRESNIYDGLCKFCNVRINDCEGRRKRIGHIKLETPVIHIWFLKTRPSKLGIILNMKPSFLEKIVYYEKYIVIKSKVKEIKKGTIITEKQYFNYAIEYGNKLVIKSGADAIRLLLRKINIKKELLNLRKVILKSKINNDHYYKNIDKYKIFKSFLENKFSLDNFILDVIPVLPPDLRPIVKVNDNKFASSDLNDLYRRIINRNIRLRKLFNLNAPEFVSKSEKKLLQEAVDCLFDNGKKSKYFKSNSNRLLKSLSDNIKGKKGRFRQNLLGKRVDYSGRSVIVVEPNMDFFQCGIPINIALELFKPFLYYFLVSKGYCNTINSAREKVYYKDKVAIWALKNIVKSRPIILNRAPTLHRLSVQSFNAFLVNDYSIHIHPLVCSEFNADFDGDQMAIHLPLSKEAVIESKEILFSNKNIYYPSNGIISIIPTQDIILGIYYLSEKCFMFNSDIKVFYSFSDIKNYYYFNNKKNSSIYFCFRKGFYIKTTIKRMFLYNILPFKNIFFNYNRQLKKKDVFSLVEEVCNRVDKKTFLIFIKNLTKLGFYFSTKSGISISLNDISTDKKKKSYLNFFFNVYNFYYLSYIKNNISNFKRHNKYLSLWNYVIGYVNRITFNNLFLKKKRVKKFRSFYFNYNNPLFSIYNSGSKSSEHQVKQLNGIRGLMMKSNGKIIDIPIISNFNDGLNSIQYFISTHGARKGLSDTSLKTANAGYLTRRLVDVSEDIIINRYDCKTKRSLKLFIDSKYVEKYFGYFICSNIYNKKKILLKKNSIFNRSILLLLKINKVSYIDIRTPITCCLINGLCVICYGIDHSKRNIVSLGSPVGVIAAQSIGEPGTQLTMRTFHTGGVYNSDFKFLNKINTNNILFGFLKLNHNIKFVKKKNFVFNKNYGSFCFFSLNGQKIFLDKNIDSGFKFKTIGSYLFRKIKLPFLGNSTIKTFSLDSKRIFFINFKINNNFYYIKKNYFILKVNNKNFCRKLFIKYIDKNKIKFFRLYKNDILKIKKGSNYFFIEVLIKKLTKVKGDITDSLNIVSNIFESRKNKNSCYISSSIFAYKKKFNKYFISNFSGGFLKVYSGIDISSCNNYIDNVILRGDKINFGEYDFSKLIKIFGLINFSKIFVNKIFNIYSYYGVNINIKHIEIILKQMSNNVIITKKGKLNNFNYEIVNKSLLCSGSFNIYYRQLFFGITKSSFFNKTFISSASFQNTVKVLVNSSLLNKKEPLIGMKDNIIAGNLIPAGTGFNFI